MDVLLTHDEILALRAAILAARLVESRPALLAGIDDRLVAALPHAATPGDQILCDLDALNAAGALSDGSYPLAIWLSNALALAGIRKEAAIFREALGGRAPRAPAPPRSARRPPSTLPPRRRLFGREEELRALDVALRGDGFSGGASAQIASIYGLAGVGKTALALEYAHRRLDEYPGGVWWVRAGDAPLDSLVQLASDLRRVGSPAVREVIAREPLDGSAAGLARAAQLALQDQGEPSLLVLDNLDAEAWLDHLPSGEVRILITTRDRRLAAGTRSRLQVLSEAGARALVTDLAGEPASDAEAAARDRVMLQLAGLPVAAGMAGRAVSEWFHAWTLYERSLAEECAEVLDDRELARGDYARGAFAALDLSIDRCPRDSAPRRLLEAAAVFAPDAVPLGWAAETAGLDLETREGARAREVLEGLGLATIDDQARTVSLHRLVHLRVRERTAPLLKIELRDRASACVTEWLRRSADPARMGEVDARRLHLVEVLLAVDGPERAMVWLVIARRLAAHLQRRARHAEALALFERAVAKAEALEPAEPRKLATALSNLSLALRDVGRSAEGIPLVERSLAIAEQLYGPEHPKVATRLTNLALMLEGTGRAAESLPLRARALVMIEASYGPDHPKVAAALSNLATAFQAASRAEEARPLLERALEIAERSLGPDHPEVAVILANLAAALQDSGTSARARGREGARAARAPRIEVTTGSSIMGLQDISRGRGGKRPRGCSRGQAEAALPLLERAVAIDAAVHGPEHPILAARLLALGAALKSLELIERAATIAKRALAIALRAHGRDSAALAPYLAFAADLERG